MIRISGARQRPGLMARFHYWFNSYEPYVMRFDVTKYYLNILYLVTIFLLTIFIYNLVDVLNNVNLLFIRLGSLILLVCIFFSLEFTYFVFRDTRKNYHNLKKGIKFLIAIIGIFIVLYLLFNQSLITTYSLNLVSSIDYSDFNLLSVSDVIDGSNVVDVDSISSKSDMKKFITFLPLPWAFLVLWVVLIGLSLIAMISYLYYTEIPRIIVFLIILAFVFMVFSYKIPYSSPEVSDVGVCDSRGNLIFEFDGNVFNQPCLEYRSSECRPSCLNKVTVCQCESTLYDFMFRRERDLLYLP